MKKFKIVGVIDEEPFDPRTWSGSSAYFFGALKRQGVLHAAVSAQPSRPIQRFYQVLSYQPQMSGWKFKYQLNLGYYRQMTRTARQALSQLNVADYEVIVQVGAWYDMTAYRDKFVVSYHDGNLARLISSPYGHPPISQAYLQKVLAYERDLYGRIDLIFPMSKWLAASFVNDFGVNPKKVFPVGAGINLPRVDDVREKKYDFPRILFVGRNFQRKGGEDLLAAFRIVRREVKDAELTIIGPELDSVPEGVRSLGYVPKTSDAGLEVLVKEYQRATAFVLPSLYEPFGISFVEAMAHRLPCIGTRICAMPEIILDGKTGYVVPPADPEELARAILKLLKEPERCRAYGDVGYQHYQENYTWESVTARMCDIIATRL